MNDTGGGVTAIHDVPGDITRIGFHWMLLFPFCHSKGGLLFCLHTECLGGYGVSLSRICEFSNCFLHTEGRGDHGFFCPDFFFVTNYRIIEYLSHGMSRSVTDFFLSRDLSLDPLTNGR